MSERIHYTRQEYIDAFKDIAMEQQVRYGIPASITLAQACLESGNGNSDLCWEAKNHFGVKAKNGEPSVTARDNGKDCQFKKYGSDMDSFVGHSQVLMYDRYLHGKGQCSKLSPTDYEGWIRGIQRGGYAEDPKYVSKILRIIDDFDLHKYDQQAMQLAQQQGKTSGYMRGKPVTESTAATQTTDNKTHLPYLYGKFALPIDLSKVQVTSEFGNHTGSHSDHVHKGLDLGTGGNLEVYATEDNGRIVSINPDNGGAGNMIVVQYERPNQKPIRCTYMHLSQNAFAEGLKPGDTVMAGQKLGFSGSSGHSTGSHLHFEVNVANDKGEFTSAGKIDPALYLAELQVRSGEDVKLKGLNGGGDYLAANKGKITIDPIQGDLAKRTGSNDPNKWLQYLQMQNNDYSDGKDAISSILTGYVTNMICCLMRIKGREAEEAAEAAVKKVEQTQPVSKDIHYDLSKVDAKQLQQSASGYYEQTMQQVESQTQQQTQAKGIS